MILIIFRISLVITSAYSCQVHFFLIWIRIIVTFCWIFQGLNLLIEFLFAFAGAVPITS